jgi:hypothetical protein
MPVTPPRIKTPLPSWSLPKSSCSGRRRAAGLLLLGVFTAALPGMGAGQGKTGLETEAAAAAETGFEPLFDGKSLAGWTRHDGFSRARNETPGGKWTVEDGCLVGAPDAQNRGGFLWSERPCQDFILRTEVKLDYPIDSGIFVRCGPTGRSHQIMLDYLPNPYIGAIFIPFQRCVFRCPEGINALRAGAWNDLEIRMEGEPAHIQVRLNGRLITDFQHTADTTRDVPVRGGIALQVHPYVGDPPLPSAGNTVRFRHLRIKKLDTQGPPRPPAPN